MIITIDGPTASGKTTAARTVAQKLGYYCINSGLLYRALAYVLIHISRVPLEQLPSIDRSIIENALSHIKVHYESDRSQMVIIIDNKRITALQLKTKELDKAASLVGVNKQTREVLTQLQQKLARDYNPIVVEGRDAGTVVFPEADVKFFLTADPYVRAMRWFNDQKKINNNFSLQQAIEFVNERDKRDQQREISPLQIASDAKVIDNSFDHESNDTVTKIIEYIKEGR